MAGRWVGGHCESILFHRSKSKAAAKSPRARRVLGTYSTAALSDDGSLYSDPAIYEVAFGGFREPSDEVDFLVDTATRLAGRQPESFLELACGPGTHAVEAARRGLRTVALDDASLMVARAQGNARRAGAKMAVVVGDMRECDFVVAERSIYRPPFDIIALLLGGLSHMLTSADAIACFKGCHALLSPAGILVLELPSPNDIFNGELLKDSGTQFGGSEGGLGTVVTWGAEEDRLDAVAQVLYRTIELEAVWSSTAESGSMEEREERNIHGAPVGTGKGWQPAGSGEWFKTLREVIPERLFTVPELELMAQEAGLRVVELHGGLEAGLDVEGEDAQRLVVVLCRKDNSIF